ncbi:Tyrosine recombinase XerC [Hartmannibacter diazotrophicus]|uniref:Tyrosine recombinase XerC n=1 Tax=Hartmannibacter diazotrophicus TaxID=1482074 RepID=A0A2C9D5T0_9HYPH|nr:site-specific integrase [Hartmannibacter diazotrophicus]SON55498.1 Tyrosine recombinase XerC [Hartmannibacter diazotrophicus]
MSVYRIRTKDGTASPIYYYDFQCGGRRFSGPTPYANKRDAERFEAERRKQARALIAQEKARKALPMTLHDACVRYWDEVGRHRASADDIWTALGHIERLLGKDKLIEMIGISDVADAVARRRAEKARGRDKEISAATVNRTFTEPLRRVLQRARVVWEKDVREIAWKEVILPEKFERVREASHAEEARILKMIREDYRPVIEFAIVTGCRLQEIVTLTWSRVQWPSEVIEIRGKGRPGKPDKVRHIPITSAVRAILWPLRHHHGEAVFTYVATRPDQDAGIARGDRVPMTYNGLKTRWRRDVRGKIDDFHFHDLRHTAFTRLVRETGNIVTVRKLAGHTDISTTAKYAHAALDDVRNAMQRVEESGGKLAKRGKQSRSGSKRN